MPFISNQGTILENPDLDKLLEMLDATRIVPPTKLQKPAVQVVAFGPIGETDPATILANILNGAPVATATAIAAKNKSTLSPEMIAKANMMLSDDVPAERVCAYLDITMDDLYDNNLVKREVNIDTYYVPVRYEVEQLLPIRATSKMDAMQAVHDNEDAIGELIIRNMNGDATANFVEETLLLPLDADLVVTAEERYLEPVTMTLSSNEVIELEKQQHAATTNN